MAHSSSPNSGLRPRLRALAMVVGSGLLLWRSGATWAVVLTFVTGGLLALSLVLPRAYAPLSRGFDRVQEGTLRIFSWLLLAIAFAVIFVPGRLIAGLRGKQPFVRHQSVDTYWKRAAAPRERSFERQY